MIVVWLCYWFIFRFVLEIVCIFLNVVVVRVFYIGGFFNFLIIIKKVFVFKFYSDNIFDEI